jgi:hypothetical protein
MKKIFRICILGAGLFLGTNMMVSGDELTPPPPPSEHGAGGNQGPAGAPIDGGLGILLALGLGYGVKKCVKAGKINSKSTSDNEDC